MLCRRSTCRQAEANSILHLRTAFWQCTPGVMPDRDGGQPSVLHAEDEEDAGASLPEAASPEAAEPAAAGDEGLAEQAAPGDKTAASHANGHPQSSGETCAYSQATACS